MSTSPERREQPADALVSTLSRWLARHVGDDELRRAVAHADCDALPAEALASLDDLADALDRAGPQEVEVAVREALEALALG